MNIALTGHSKGLGKALFDKLNSTNKILGFSRSNGYDIKNPNDRKKIISEIKDFDVFINLVHNYYHQTDILFELHQKWQGQNKKIINISTSAVDDDKFGLGDYSLLEYKLQKTNLENMSKWLAKKNAHSLLRKNPQVITYRISEINLVEDTKNIISIINETIPKE